MCKWQKGGSLSWHCTEQENEPLQRQFKKGLLNLFNLFILFNICLHMFVAVKSNQ